MLAFPHRYSEISEARFLLQWAAKDLSPTERIALSDLAYGYSDSTTAETAGVTQGGVWMARKTGLDKMRRRLRMLRIQCVGDLLS